VGEQAARLLRALEGAEHRLRNRPEDQEQEVQGWRLLMQVFAHSQGSSFTSMAPILAIGKVELLNKERDA
jgi:hypothetical protein